MALFPPVDSVVAASKPVPSSKLKHQQKLQHKLVSDKRESLNDLCAQKSQSYSYSQSAETSQYGSSYGGSFSAGLQRKYLASQTKTLPVKSVPRQKEGVDRAHPLKPIFQHRVVSVPEVNTAQPIHSPYMEEAQNSSPGSMSKVKPSAERSQLLAVFCPWTAGPEQSALHLHRRQWAYILKLEENIQHMDKEIEKEKAILKEKLRRTQQTLIRIQKEKELSKAEERTDREEERAPEQKATRHPEEKTSTVADRSGDRVLGGAQSAEATIPKPGTTPHPQELAMKKLKKELLVASNSRIRDCISMECLGSSSKLAPKRTPSPSALADQDYGDHPSAEVLHRQPPSAVKEERLGQCSLCGRKFLCARLEKHMSICSKIQESQRKVFDSRKARARGTELERYQRPKSSESLQDKAPIKSNWKQKHESLMKIVQQAHQVQQALSKGGKMSDLPPLPPIENPDYVSCPYCSRRFAPRVAERHIPKCKNIKSKPPPPQQRLRC